MVIIGLTWKYIVIRGLHGNHDGDTRLLMAINGFLNKT